MSFVRLIAAALAALSMAACAGTPETGQGPRENTGTLVGAVAGGLIGSQFGGGTGERIAAGLAGAALGGLIGNRIGAGMDDDDKRRAYAAQMQALEGGKSGAAVAWKNPDSGRYGSVVPGPAYQSNGMQCRQYTHTIYAAMARWFPARPISRTACSAGSTPTPSILTAGRRSPAATLAAIRTAPGPRWASGSPK